LIENGRISRVGPAHSVGVPAAAETLDFTSHTVLPGLIDCHVHLVFSAGTNPLADVLTGNDFAVLLRGAANARLALRAGVTTVGGRGGGAQTKPLSYKKNNQATKR
jgi:imidazolonepropionase-like amidohydrolase